MKGFIDTIFNPIIGWLTQIFNSIVKMSVPLSQPLDLGKYMGPFILLGGPWITFIVVSFSCGAIYLICFLVAAYKGTFIKYKDFIKWW